ncbi:MAG: FIG00636423: hypothetical protein, partial [uncultured Sphingomonadaceae bacterium]
ARRTAASRPDAAGDAGRRARPRAGARCGVQRGDRPVRPLARARLDGGGDASDRAGRSARHHHRRRGRFGGHAGDLRHPAAVRVEEGARLGPAGPRPAQHDAGRL